MKVRGLAVRKIFDSRGNPTIEVALEDEKGEFLAQIPSGASTGENEASVFEYEKAKAAGEQLFSELEGKEFGCVREIDEALLHIDDTPRKEKLGGNVCLGVSMAAARALAAEKQKPVWKLLSEEFFSSTASDQPPLIFANLINGGAHANNNLDVQEYMVVGESAEKIMAFYDVLGETLKKKFKVDDLVIGDEGGYVLDFESNEVPLAILEELRAAQFRAFLFALDAAASQFVKAGGYTFEGRAISSAELQYIYEGYFQKFEKLLSIEDPFDEHDREGFQRLYKAQQRKLIVGDDLTTTNPKSIEDAIQAKLINAVIVKPNQIGTVSETCEAMRVAQRHDAKIIVSHRSGETKDHFIISLARAGNAYGVKIGAPARERLGKYEELARVYEDIL